MFMRVYIYKLHLILKHSVYLIHFFHVQDKLKNDESEVNWMFDETIYKFK